MRRPRKATPQEIERAKFADELKVLIGERLSQINHFIAGCDSPFTYSQIAAVQEHLQEINTILGIGGSENEK